MFYRHTPGCIVQWTECKAQYRDEPLQIPQIFALISLHIIINVILWLMRVKLNFVKDRQIKRHNWISKKRYVFFFKVFISDLKFEIQWKFKQLCFPKTCVVNISLSIRANHLFFSGWPEDLVERVGCAPAQLLHRPGHPVRGRGPGAQPGGPTPPSQPCTGPSLGSNRW